MKTIAALFDVDGTLFTGHVWRGMLDYFRAQGGSGQCAVSGTRICRRMGC